MPKNEKDGVVFKNPKDEDERKGIAKVCTKSLALTLPTVVDGMENKVESAYGAWPERLYVVGKDGKIAYKGGAGPRDFSPSELGKFLDEFLAVEENARAKP